MFAFANTDFGLPNTAAYRIYESLNRLTCLPLLLMACGWLGLGLSLPYGNGRKGAWTAFVASIMMAIGTAAEFWLFSDQPYGVWNNGRMISYMTFFISSIVLYISATVVGINMRRMSLGPFWGALLMLMAVPLYLTTILVLNTNFLAPAVLALVNGLVLWHLPDGNRVSTKMILP